MRLADLTTIGLGGPADAVVHATAKEEVVRAVVDADASGQPLLVLGGGSNVVVADAGFSGTVIRIVTRGVTAAPADRRVRLTVAAGEPWDQVVTLATAERLAGIECLAGIPGTAGATPIQNVGAYGQQVSDTIVSVRAYDRRAGTVIELGSELCGFAYRSSVFRVSARFVVLSVSIELERSRLGRPVVHAELARRLSGSPGVRPPLAEIGEAVIALRREKGMVLDPNHDPDSIGVGSFFVNPTMSPERFVALRSRTARLGCATGPPWWQAQDGQIKTSAAWLIEQSGFRRGFAEGRVGISAKHTLALVNRGGATTAELIALARQIRLRVESLFGVALAPEPTLVGVEL